MTNRKQSIQSVLAVLAAVMMLIGCEPDVGLGPSVDINPPVVNLSSHPLNAYISGSSVTLSGSATDDQSVKAVDVTVDGQTFNATVTDTTWSLVLDTTALTDGKKEFSIKGTDKDDKTMTFIWGLNVDNHAPVVLLSSPSLSASQLNDKVQINGSAYDNLELESVTITITTVEATPRVLVDAATVDGLFNWSYLFDSNTADGGSPFNGDCTMAVTATDSAGNESVRFYHEETISAADSDILSAKNIFSLENGGTVDGVDPLVYTPAYMTGTLAITERDYAINQSTDLPVITLDEFPEIGTVTFHTSNKIRLEVTDDDMLASVQYSIDGGSFQSLLPLPKKTLTWEYPLSGYVSDQGTHTIRIQAADNNTPARESDTLERTFVVDAGPPNLTVTDQNLFMGSSQQGSFVLSGTASDGSSVSEIEIEVDGQIFNAALTETVPQNYTWTYTVDPVASGIAEGETVVTVRAVDEGSNIKEISIPVTIDLTDPTLVLTGPSETLDQNGLLTIRGTADDNFQIARTEYSINGGSLNLFATSYTWEKTIITTDYDDASGLGILNFLVRVTDKSGRFVEDTFTYDIDQSTDKPAIAFGNLDILAVNPRDNALDADPVLMGSISDDDSVDVDSIQISINGDAWEAVDEHSANDNQEVTWSHDLAGSTEGIYSVAIRAYDTETAVYTDVYKSTTTVAVPFVIDSDPPSLSNILPAAASYRNGNFTITGEAFDSLGVDTVTVSINGGVAIDVNTSDDFDHWDYPIVAATYGEGPLQVRVTARDSSGKQYFSDFQYFIDLTDPVVANSDILPAEGSSVNGIIKIQGSASDPTAIGKVARVEYSFGNTGVWTDISAAGLYSWKIASFSSFNYDQYVLGTAPTAGDLAAVTGMVTGDYYKVTAPASYYRYDGSAWQVQSTAVPWNVAFKVQVTDGADNTTVETRNMVIDQTSDAPDVTLSNLNAAGNAATNLLETNPRILGLVVDDDGINSGINANSIVEISFDYDGSNEGTATWTPVTVNGTGTNITWSYNLYSGVTLIPAVTEGVNEFSIRARDIIVGTAGDTTYNKSILGPVEFAIDLAAPVIAMSSGSVDTGSYLNATGGNLVFTVTEANDSAMVLTINGSSTGITPTANPDEYTWTINTGSLSQGPNSFTIRAVDNFGKTTERIVSVTVDKVVPGISLNNLTENAELNGNIFTLSGSIDEPYGLDTVGYPITARIYLGAALVTSGTVTNSYSWTYDIDMDSLVSGDTTGLADNQTYTLTISARDMAGNIATSNPLTFSVNQSLDLPKAALSNLAAADDELRPATISIIHADGKEILAGVLYSSSSINTAGVTLTVGGVNRTGSMVFQGSGTIVPFYLDMSNATTYPDNVYSVSVGLPGGVETLYDVIGNNVSLVNTGTKIIGQVEDDDVVHAYSISIDGADVVSQSGNTGKLYNPTYTVAAGISSGIHLIKLTSTDASGLSTATWSLLVKDTGAPVVTIASPTQGAYVNDDVSTDGTATDDYALKNLSIIAYRADSTPIYDFGTSETWTKTNNKNWSWDFTLEALPDIYSSESVTLEYKATDFVGSQTAKQRAITVDNMDPTGDIRYPAADETLNGAIEIRGTANDAGLDTVRIRIGYYPTPGNWVGSGLLVPDGTYNWSYNLLNVVSYANRLYAQEQFVITGTYANTAAIGSPVIGAKYYLTDTNTTVQYTASGTFQTYYDLWQSGIEVIITDRAGNSETIFQNIKIDANSDRPIVTVVQPMQATSKQGGTVMVFGTARDDDALLRLEAQVDVNGDGDFADSIDLYNGSAFVYDGDTNDDFEIETQWYEIDGTESWTVEFNKFGELYSRGTHLGDGGLTGTVTIRIRAVDINGVVSNVTTRIVELDNTVPVIDGLNYLSGAYVHGNINLTASITDDVNGGVKNVAVSYNNGSNWTPLYDFPTSFQDSSINFTPDPPNAPKTVSLDLPLQTLNSSSPAYIASSDVLYLVLRVTDTSSYQTLKYVYFNVDNQPPSANLKLDDPVIFNPYDIYGEETVIYGHATDVGTISGLKRVIVYITKGSTVYDVQNGGSEPLVDTGDYAAVEALNDYSVTGSEEVYAMILNDMNEYGEDASPNGDDDLINEYLTAAIGGTDWWLNFDSTNVPDGDVVIHYVVEDQAGNVMEYTENAIIANNKPQFVTTLIGDDIDRSGSVSDVEMFPYPATGTRPRIIEEVEVTVTMDKTCVFTVYYGDLTNVIRTETVVASLTFTFSETSLGSGNTYTAGNHKFYIRAEDSNEVISIKEISLTVADTDGTDPVLQIFPLSAAYTDSRDNQENISNINSSNQMRPVLTDPEALINGTTQGHIELTDYTLNDTVGEEDADVSGIVTLRGYVYDNRGLKAISGTVAGFASGTPRDLNGDLDTVDTYEANVLAYWDSATGRLVSNATDFTNEYELFTITSVTALNPFSTENQGLNQDGHILYWTYKIDTSRITGQAALDTLVTFTGIDFYGMDSNIGATAFTNTTDGYEQIDVVPYVTDITRVAPYATIRSRYGAYVVRQGEIGVMVNGYNLNAAGTMRISANKTGALGTYTDITGYTVNGTFTRLTADIPATANSGWLRLTVGAGTVEAINNLNEPTLASNKEASSVPGLDGSTNWTDDRYLHVWRSGNTADSDYFGGTDSTAPKYPAMGINPVNDRLYASWSSYGTSSTYYKGITDANPTRIFQTYDPSENTDIHLDSSGNMAVAYNANYYRNAGWNDSINDAGGVYVYNPNAPVQYGTYRLHRFELLYHDELLMQFTNQRVVRNGNIIYVTWYDTDVSAIKFGTRAYNSGTTTELPIVNIDGGNDDGETPGDNPNETLVAAGRSASAGEYAALAVDEDGYPVIMYYDATNQTLKLARTGTVSPIAANWTLQTVFGTGDQNKQYSGKHVSMKIDTDGYLHAVFYNTSSGDLIYIKSNNNPEGGAAYEFGDSVVIDSIGSVGTGADLTLSGTTPYVSYLDTSRLNSFNGLKMAFYSTIFGGWEYMNVPLGYEVLDARTSVEHKYVVSTTWELAIGYLSSDYYRVAYYQPTP